jgi:hypothetical protein
VSQDKDANSIDSNKATAPKGINIFPTEVWIFPPPTKEKLRVNELLNMSLELKNSKGEQSADPRSARHAWRKESPHLERNFETAFLYINEILSAVCQKLGVKGGTRAFDTWLNIIEPGGYQVSHNHAPNLLSGILLLSDCVKTSRLILRDPRPTRQCFPETQLGPSEIPVASSAGSAIIFPGWLEHWVEENESGSDSVYIAFNLGNIIKDQPPTVE